jgi:RNA recognition motif-containing protein
MNQSIYIGNLPADATEQEIRDLFSPFGEITRVHLVEGKNFGFVEMEKEASAAAITALHDSDLRGNKLTVNEARPRA